MPLYQWTLIGPEQRGKDTEEGATKAIKGTRDASLHLENEEAHNPTDPPTETLHHEGHASNVDRWATSQETALGRRNRRESTLSTTTTTSQSTSRPPPYPETMWPP